MANKSDGLLQKVRAKIEEEFGLRRQFSHLDFEELLGEDKAKDRNRIGVLFCGLKRGGAIKIVSTTRGVLGTKRCRMYKVVKLPLGGYVRRGEEKVSAKPDKPLKSASLDTIMFNLGRAHREAEADI